MAHVLGIVLSAEDMQMSITVLWPLGCTSWQSRQLHKNVVSIIVEQSGMPWYGQASC